MKALPQICLFLLISHDLHIVMSKTDRVICLNGHVCCSGTPAKVASSEEFKLLFGERAASGLALYEHHHDHEHLPDGSIKTSEWSQSQNNGSSKSLVSNEVNEANADV